MNEPNPIVQPMKQDLEIVPIDHRFWTALSEAQRHQQALLESHLRLLAIWEELSRPPMIWKLGECYCESQVKVEGDHMHACSVHEPQDRQDAVTAV